MTSNKIELLSGPAVQDALTQADAKVYRYELNPVGLMLAVGVAFVFYGLGAFCYWQTGLSNPLWMILFVALMFTGVGFTAVAAYWHQFATQHLVGVSTDRLFVGGPKATWVIAWELLDRKSMGFEQMQMTRLRGALEMRVSGQDIKLHLFNAIAYLSDIEAFMHGVLSHLQITDDAAAGTLTADDAVGEEE